MRLKIFLGLALCLILQQQGFSIPKSFSTVSTEAIVSKLCAEIGIASDIKQKVSDIITAYMDEKVKIIPLLDSDKKAYAEKQASYFKTLKTKLSEVLIRTQLEKFMQLKPKPSETDNALYYLYY